MESYAVRDDVYNYQGASLFGAYKLLWDAVHDYDIGLSPNTLSVEHAFMGLSTFPFSQVTELMTDYLRKLLRAQLSLLFLPYTKKQMDAIQRLRYYYPTSDEIKGKLNQIVAYSESLVQAMSDPYTDYERLSMYKPFQHYVDKLTALVYQIPKEHLWIVCDKLLYTFVRTNEYTTTDNKINTVREYLKKYKSTTTLPEKPFEQQLVDDITSLLIYSYPHPEMVLALENALQILDLYYSPLEASKLFIYDARHKIKRYIQYAKDKLDVRLLEWFRRGTSLSLDNETTDEPPTIEYQYNEFLLALNRYQVTGKGYQDVVEKANLLKQKPYTEVRGLPSFAENMSIVDNINPFI